MNKQLWRIFVSCVLLLGLYQSALALGPAKPHKISALCASTLSPQPAQVLYDSSAGTLPSAQQWEFIISPGAQATQVYSNGLAVLNTFTQTSDQSGYFVAPTQPITLDRSLGFGLNFTIQVIAETHNNPHRAGFSLIVLASDGKGIELGFWTDSVWAQGDGIHPASTPLFNRAENAAFNTTHPVTYQLSVLTDMYTLLADGAPILSGPVRDYSAFNGFPDPYETPNLIFMGDDTSSAKAQIGLGNVAVSTCRAASPGVFMPVVLR